MIGCDHVQPVSKPPSAESKPSANSLKNDASQRVVSPDWGNAATLMAMGYPPVATGDVPTESVMFSASGKVATWADYTEPTRTLGRLIGQPAAAEAYIQQSKQDMEQAGAQLQVRYPRVNKFAVVQFFDANNMRMYVNKSLFKPAFAAMGKELVVLGEGNRPLAKIVVRHNVYY